MNTSERWVAASEATTLSRRSRVLQTPSVLPFQDKNGRITYVEGLIQICWNAVHHAWNKIDGIEFDVTEAFFLAEIKGRLGEDVPRDTLMVSVLRANRFARFFSEPYLWNKYLVALTKYAESASLQAK